MLEEQILKAMKETKRQYCANRHGGVFPWMVLARMDIEVSEKTIQRRMRKLAQEGQIVRIGIRSGYALSVS